ncbi:hypothetical protein BJ085DRAFT_31391 [Dimargaris cristalligena]|uniref:Uncharacterized protein n=1 Tax=Dimargaris cristalligena TaxID=215637 RepID=A0A4P9ZUI1_9FUNG|nr:hypothetical protein BJ085DRAFT_31391 [Dimargaris cristalligena]|eukprot:RKP36908.1 hypothetical protein BJ085DRAFT_31391 [Dimargaris cristalligena]
MNPNTPRQPTGYSIPDYQPSELQCTFVARLDQYARNKDILSFFSVCHAQTQVYRPLCFQRICMATSSFDAQEMHRVLFKYWDNIRQVTLVLDSEAPADPIFFAFLGISIDTLLFLKKLIIEVRHPALLDRLVHILGLFIQLVENIQLVSPRAWISIPIQDPFWFLRACLMEL